MILLTILFLALMEISLSFDNVIINAAVLKNMEPRWQHRFLTWGMPIAVGGMRLLFPVAIVCFAASLSPYNAVLLAFNDPGSYAIALGSVRTTIDAFGGTFLLMIFLAFLFEEKEHYWFHWAESRLTKFGGIDTPCRIIIVLILGLECLKNLGAPATLAFGLYIVIQHFAGDEKAVRKGLGGFLYLELIDAICSFDGVIGAFVLTNNIFYIAIGLGIGAFFIRLLTLRLVKGGVLKEYIYLEHGAHYAIGALGLVMLIDIWHKVPEPVTGMCGISIIILAWISSWLKNKAVLD